MNTLIDVFNKVCDTLETIDEGLNDESKALLFISSLPKSMENTPCHLMNLSQHLKQESYKQSKITRRWYKWRVEKKKQEIEKNKSKNLKCFQCPKEGDTT